MKERNVVIAVLIWCTLVVIAQCTSSTGCSTHQKRVDTISNVMYIVDENWKQVETTLVTMHDNSLFTSTQWNSIVLKRNTISENLILFNHEWELLPKTDASIEEFINDPNFQTTLKLIIELCGDTNLPKIKDTLGEFVK